MISPPASHRTGPDYLNVLRFLDVPQAAGMAADLRPLKITSANPPDWAWTIALGKQRGWPANRLQFTDQFAGSR